VRFGLALGLAALLAALMAPGNAAALTGRQLLSFEQFPEHTEISTQYESQGIIFEEEEGGFYPEIRWDESSYTNPVLGGTFGFGSKISAKFVVPGTTTPAPVEDLAMDVGFIDDPGSTILTVERTSGPFGLTADEYGFNHLELPLGEITGFSVQNFESESQGWEIDNVEYTIPTPPPAPAPPPPPPTPAPVAAAPSCPKYLLVDSRGSGEKKGIFSPPGEEFDVAFEGALGLYGQHAIDVEENPYSAVGVFGWNPDEIDNGIEAFITKGQIGVYHNSVHEGEIDLNHIVHAEVSGRCGGQTQIVLLGYSQGAEVAGDVFQGLAPKEAKRVAAVVLFGDPLYNHRDKDADQAQRSLDGSLGTRPQFAASESTEVLSYCNEKDPICQWRLPLPTLAAKRLSEHKKYWGDSSSPAEVAARAVAKFVSGKH
jgi:Cutinase